MAIIILNRKGLNAFPVTLWTGQGCPVSSHLLNIVLEVLTRAAGQENEIKGHPDWKRRIKTVFAGEAILRRENSEESMQKLLELVNVFNRVARYKINTQKSIYSIVVDNPKMKLWSNSVYNSIKQKRNKFNKSIKLCTLKTVKHSWKKL